MNILHVVNVFFVVPYFLGNQMGYFKKLGNNMFLICSPSEELKKESQIQGFRYTETIISRSISPFLDLKSTIVIYRYIKKNHIDVVVGHTPKGGLLAMLASFFSRVPKRIYYRHGLVFETAKGLKRSLLINMDRLAAKLSTQVIVVSPSVYKESIKYKLNPEKKQMLINKGTCNGIDLDKFNINNLDQKTVNKLRQELNIYEDAIVIGFTGRLVRDKGIVELINAFKQISYKHPKACLLLVGMLETRDALPDYIVDEIRNNDKIINTGYVKNNIIEYYYALMDIYILPSYREGFPTSVLEASAMKLPVITTKSTGCIDSIIEHVTGKFVTHNVESISSAIENFIIDKNLIKEYGNNGRDFVASNFDQKIVWEHIKSLYLNNSN